MSDGLFPDAAYADTVLAVNFADFQQYFAEALIEIHRAHLAMLRERGIVSAEDAASLLTGLDHLDREQLRAARFDGSCEDFFFFVESLLEAQCGADVAGRLHTARSRNDIAITLYRMVTRRELLHVFEEVLALRLVLLKQATAHVDTIMPAYTHTQPAQPTTLAHYLMAAAEFLARDAGRLQAAFHTVNRSPLGACAITTTGFPISRERTAGLLGFECLAVNSYGAIAAVDYILESAAAVAILMVNLGRLTQDLLLWSMQEFRFLSLPAGFVQGSSIMPQKRNPVALEHTRILASRAFSEAQAAMTSLHNTPFGDIVDSEDDLQPLAFTMFADARRVLRLLAASMESAQFDTARMAACASGQFLTATELADTLVREAHLSFRQAHHLVSEAVQANPEDESPVRIAADLLRVAPGIASREVLLDALDPRTFIERRRITGGPAPAAIEPELERARELQGQLSQWARERGEALAAAHAELLAWRC
ncbi:MAG: argininosuccinate lyase [Terriglobia bacterium]|nr:MAG: argininosuccinate lyase [Terriglobia bacterium]